MQTCERCGHSQPSTTTFAQIQWAPDDILEMIVDVDLTTYKDITAADAGLTYSAAAEFLSDNEDMITAATRAVGWHYINALIWNLIQKTKKAAE